MAVSQPARRAKVAPRFAGTPAWREGLTGFLFILPVMAYVVVIFGYPAAYTLILTVSHWDFIGGMTGFSGLENYTSVWNDSLFWQSLSNTLYFTV